MRSWIRLPLALSCAAVSVYVATACGSSPPANKPPPTPAFPDIDAGDPDAGTERYMPDLFLDERKKLCDWVAGTLGGYGKVTQCDGSAVVNFKNQDACLAQYISGCNNLQVADYETCIKVIAQDVCSDALYTAPECHDVARCIGKTDGGLPDPGDGG